MTPLLIEFSRSSDTSSEPFFDTSSETDASTPSETVARTPPDTDQPSDARTPPDADQPSDDGPPADRDVHVEPADDGVIVTIGETTRRLSPETAATLRDAIGDAVHRRQTFVRTASEVRPDGSYALYRRGSDEPAKVFDSRRALRAAYRELPGEFEAEAIEAVSGSRRHLLVRHFAEHPGFDCRLVCRNPLTVEKQ